MGTAAGGALTQAEPAQAEAEPRDHERHFAERDAGSDTGAGPHLPLAG
ncbi:hypothetical protein GCM10027072_60300 [Streptomyces bullii]